MKYNFPHSSTRPLSPSALWLWEDSPEKWFNKYCLGLQEPPSKEMLFGKKVADSFQTDTPLVPFILYPVVEHKLEVNFGKQSLLGFIDTYDPISHNFREFKTSKTLWSKSKAQNHKQLHFYAFCIYLIHKIPPEKYTIHLDCVQTKDIDDNTVRLIQPLKTVTHEIKLKLVDLLKLGAYINKTVEEMKQYANSHL